MTKPPDMVVKPLVTPIISDRYKIFGTGKNRGADHCDVDADMARSCRYRTVFLDENGMKSR
jgi:hypothetical protein